MSSILDKLKIPLARKYKKNSYSQCGEDLIIEHIMNSLKIEKPKYIDIGAHHPFYLSNTALFYLKGSTGINIEPDPYLFKEFKKYRKRDLNLNIGVHSHEDELDFYIMSARTLNTFSESEAQRYAKEYGYKIKSIEKVKVDNTSNIIFNYCNGNFPDILSLDVEGIELDILKSIDYSKNYPVVVCCETLSFSNRGDGIKNTDIINFLKSVGYVVYADTYINTIFVKKDS